MFRHISVQQSLRSPNVFFRQQSLKLGLSLGPFSELPLTHYSQRKLTKPHRDVSTTLTHSAAIVVELECSLDVVLEGAQLHIAEEVLHKGFLFVERGLQIVCVPRVVGPTDSVYTPTVTRTLPGNAY